MKIKELKILYKETEEEIKWDDPFKSSDNIFEFSKKCHWTEEPVENVWLIVVDAKLRPICHRPVSTGTLNEASLHPRDVFISVILSNGQGFFMVHNHPSGSLEPSQADIDTVKRLLEGSKILGLVFYDSIIITENEHYSIRKEFSFLWENN